MDNHFHIVVETIHGRLNAGVRHLMDHNLLVVDAEIPRLQRRTSAPPLARFAAMPKRNLAIVRACATG